MTDAAAGAAPPLPQGRFAGRDAFRQLVRDALACAAREGWRELLLCDASFEDWPLGERAVAETLLAWSRNGRRLTLLACGYAGLQRQHPRFVAWRRTWDHIIECRGCRQADPLEFPSVVWSPAWTLQRLDTRHSTGWCGSEPERRVQVRECVDEWLRKSAAAFPATTLGL
ncbi:hypothetical protein PY257_15275 [Ramlibacter sp. H39-3-26]|nr:hypothetical protein [Ramlibacter sp. H39-3-26]MDF1486525.1 hypothetical protein [Ramlibacter sp. H39-3-26]